MGVWAYIYRRRLNTEPPGVTTLSPGGKYMVSPGVTWCWAWPMPKPIVAPHISSSWPSRQPGEGTCPSAATLQFVKRSTRRLQASTSPWPPPPAARRSCWDPSPPAYSIRGAMRRPLPHPRRRFSSASWRRGTCPAARLSPRCPRSSGWTPTPSPPPTSAAYAAAQVTSVRGSPCLC